MNLLSIIGALVAAQSPEVGQVLAQPEWDYHAATQDRRAWRALKRQKGARQARLQKKAERRAVREGGL